MGCNKAVLRGKFIAIQSYLMKPKKHQTYKLTLHIKQVKEEEEPLKLVEEKKNHKDQSRKKWRKQYWQIKVKGGSSRRWTKLTNHWPNSSRKKGEESNQQNYKQKGRDYNRQCRNTKDHKRLWATVC